MEGLQVKKAIVVGETMEGDKPGSKVVMCHKGAYGHGHTCIW